MVRLRHLVVPQAAPANAPPLTYVHVHASSLPGYQTPRCVLREGDVLNPADLPDEILSRADVVFWNNYGGHWEQDISVADDGRPVRLQDQVRDRLLGSMHEGARGCRL